MSLIPASFRDTNFTITDDGGNSATLQLATGTVKVSGLKPGGAELVKTESKGQIVGARKGKRAYPQITIDAVLAAPMDDFKRMLLGTIAGFVSTTADIGDYPAVDANWDLSYGAETRNFQMEDIVGTVDFDLTEDGKVSFSFEVLGGFDADGEEIIPSR